MALAERVDTRIPLLGLTAARLAFGQRYASMAAGDVSHLTDRPPDSGVRGGSVRTITVVQGRPLYRCLVKLTIGTVSTRIAAPARTRLTWVKGAQHLAALIEEHLP